MAITSEIVADSLNPCGNRLTTFVLQYPRWIHSELLTHRMFSKNAASSRAIPIEKMIQQVIDNPAMPVFWGKNQSGMQANEELDNEIQREQLYEELDGYKERETDYQESPCGCTLVTSYSLTDLETAQIEWLKARDNAIKTVKKLNEIGLHKQIANRLLEPWFNIRIILSGTEFENFFALRAHKDAQPELQKLAYLMLEQYNQSKPKLLQPGEWHIPFGDKIEDDRLNTLPSVIQEMNRLDEMGYCGDYTSLYVAKQEIKKKIAVARCARISYFNFEGKDDYEADIKLCDRLFGNVPRHLSPAEHVAQAIDSNNFIGNYRGFRQYRKMFENENLTDDRVKKTSLSV